MSVSVDTIRVLHVDDEPGFADMAGTFLTREDDRFVVDTATSAADALDRFDTTDYDCIVADYDMPGQNGLEFLETVRGNHPELPFILFTGKGSEEIASEAISAGVTDYLQKTGNTDQYKVLANRITNLVEKYHAEQAQERNRVLVEEATDAIFIVDTNATIQYATPSAESVLGRPPADLLGTSGFEQIHPGDQTRVMEAFAELAADPGARRRVEFRYVRPDGSVIWTEARGRNLLEEPSVNGIAIYARDITERKADEETLLELRDRMAFALDTTDSILYELDPATETETRHGPFERIYGVPESAAASTEAFYAECVHPEDRTALEAIQRELIEGDRDTGEVLYRTHPDNGSVRWMRSPMATVDTDGGTPRVIGLATDVTDLKERERELERYETIIETSGDPMYTLDTEGHFTYVNQAFEELTGYDEATLIGAHASFVMPDEDVVQGRDLVQSLLSTDRDRGTFEMDLLTDSGQRIPCENHMGLLPFEEKFQGTVGILRDMTMRNRREAQLEHQNERLDEFVRVVSHDLRNPLNVATGRLDLLAEEVDSEHLDAAYQALERMAILIEDLLALARNGAAALEEKQVPLPETVQQAWASVDTADATLAVETDRTVWADGGRLQQLFENLFRNAVKHGGPEVAVRVGDTDTGVFVADDGEGISVEPYDQVFETGFSTADTGTGFGLSIVQETVDAHGWSIRLSDSRGGGARFDITGLDES